MERCKVPRIIDKLKEIGLKLTHQPYLSNFFWTDNQGKRYIIQAATKTIGKYPNYRLRFVKNLNDVDYLIVGLFDNSSCLNAIFQFNSDSARVNNSAVATIIFDNPGCLRKALWVKQRLTRFKSSLIRIQGLGWETKVHHTTSTSGAYILVKNNCVVYIGQSYHLGRRMNKLDILEKDYDKVFYIEILNSTHRRVLESVLISYFRPKGNKNGYIPFLTDEHTLKCVLEPSAYSTQLFIALSHLSAANQTAKSNKSN